MQREDGVAGKALEQAFFHHAAPAAQAFLGRLEDQVQRAVEAALLRDDARGGQQDARVAVVAAGVHLAGHLAGVRQAGGLLNRQRVHVGAQAQAPRAIAARQRADHAGAGQAAVHLVAPFGQARGHQLAGHVLFVGQLGVGVDLVAQADHLGRDLAHGGQHALEGGGVVDGVGRHGGICLLAVLRRV
ncbi:hypothetical protein D3C72_1433200 [compost metagenome]